MAKGTLQTSSRDGAGAGVQQQAAVLPAHYEHLMFDVIT